MSTGLVHIFCVLLCSLVLFSCQPSPPPFECTDPIGCVDIAPGDALKIGVIQALSGPMGHIGTEQTRAIELALAAQDNQFRHHPIELLVEDGQCSSEGGRIAAMKLVAEPKLVAILGTTCSGSATAMVDMMSDAGLSMISGTNTATSLTSVAGTAGEHWQPGYFRTAGNDAAAAETASAFVFEELGLRQVATIDDGDAYTRNYTDAFKQAFTQRGGQVVLDTTIDKGDTDMRPVLTAVARSGAESIFFPVFSPEADFIVLQARDMPALQHTILLGGGMLLTDNFIASANPEGIGTYIVSAQPIMNPGIVELRASYEATYLERVRTNGLEMIYDATHVLLHALETIVIQEQDGTLHIGRQALRDALYATDGYEGITGRLHCDRFGDCSAIRFVILRFEDPAAGLEGFYSNIVYSPDGATHHE